MRAAIFLCVIALSAMGSAVFVGGKHIQLTALSTVEISAEPTTDPQSARIIARLAPGASVDVLSCQDLKHYLVPQVRLPDGQTGYIAGGQFELRRSGISLVGNKPIVFSCP